MNNKIENFDTLTSKESKGRAKKVKNIYIVRGKPLGKCEKPQQVKDKILHSLKALYYVKV